MLKSVGTIGFFTAISRVLGLARDVLMAGLFGTSVYMSAFVVAFTIPNLFRRLFGEGALSSALVPVFVQTSEEEGVDRAWALARKMFTLVGAGLGALTLLVVAVLGWVNPASVEHPLTREALLLLRIMFPYMFFICLAALAMALLHARKRFAVPAFAPALLNMVWIGTAIWVAPIWADQPSLQIRAIAFGVLAAGVLQWGFQFPLLFRLGYRPGIQFDPSDRRVRRVFALMGPAALGLAVTQVNVLIDRLLAAWIGPWAPAALYFSERLIYLPLGLFATAMSTVLLPVLSEHAAQKGDEAFAATVLLSLKQVLFVVVPSSAGLYLLSEPITQMIFEWKSFGAASTGQTAVALAAYAPGLIVFSLPKVFVPAFYARQDTKTPVRLSLHTLGLNVSLNLLFILTFPREMKHAGLALATVLAETYYGLALWRCLKQKTGHWKTRGFGGFAVRLCAATFLMMGAVYAVYAFWPSTWAFGPDKLHQWIRVLGTIGAGIATYFAVSWALGQFAVFRKSSTF